MQFINFPFALSVYFGEDVEKSSNPDETEGIVTKEAQSQKNDFVRLLIEVTRRRLSPDLDVRVIGVPKTGCFLLEGATIQIGVPAIAYAAQLIVTAQQLEPLISDICYVLQRQYGSSIDKGVIELGDPVVTENDIDTRDYKKNLKKHFSVDDIRNATAPEMRAPKNYDPTSTSRRLNQLPKFTLYWLVAGLIIAANIVLFWINGVDQKAKLQRLQDQIQALQELVDPQNNRSETPTISITIFGDEAPTAEPTEDLQKVENDDPVRIFTGSEQ